MLNSCRRIQNNYEYAPNDINHVVVQMTDLMIHDVTSPPLASRFFAYSTLAGYEVVTQNNSAFKSMHGRLRGYPALVKPDTIAGYDYRLASLLAMIETAKKLQPSGSTLQAYEDSLLAHHREAGLSANQVVQSLKYAIAISQKILLYAKADGYNKISNYQRYTPANIPGSWYPTPPAFIEAVEPWFKTVRPFTLDTCIQFAPPPPVAFSEQKNSAFYKMMQQNYKEPPDEDQKKIAAFWDCNPFAVQDNGHLMVGIKKISPGAHWMGIAGTACEKANKNFDETFEIMATVSVGLMDAFICCWDEKYRSNRIRPETAIRKYIDPSWTPLLQTPPFPEYLSGHSTISGSSATILTHYFGENFSYTDSVEVKYGLWPRQFSSFNQAANEAAISRFYGGIHFMDAIDNGLEQGREVGNWVLGKLARRS